MNKINPQTQNEILINHHPVNYHSISIFLILIWTTLCLSLPAVFENSISQIIIPSLLMFAGMIGIGLLFSHIEKQNISVTYNSQTIEIHYKKKTKIIPFSEIDSISYYIYDENNGYRNIVKRLELIIAVGTKEYLLNDKIDRKQIESCKAGTNKTAPLMQLYTFTVRQYPDIAAGYQE